MNIEFNDETIEQVAIEIAAAARFIITKHLEDLEEEALIREVRATIDNPKEKVLAYLQRKKGATSIGNNTERVEVLSEYLRMNLFIPPITMKKTRDQFEHDREILVRKRTDGLTILYFRPE